ncbi:recombinase family protein [Haloferax sulfurifontis]|uniref:Resolvase domain-containing protein n=1 Tax=Haloferax sulfurifontis ATCC BAA-897 TaxID=662480 RepID=M0I6T5_9EURY|nr:recombinase family protein [Haloferax sulfurifontis]ELZ91154.1 resolvase domain-containing protein [Haloferax sulfurifontis ATCC BAA-897]
MPSKYATYIRKSTAEQDDKHQRQDIKVWLDNHNLKIGDVDVYSEQGSGASADRDEFLALINEIESDTYTDVVVWEVSRIARKGFLAQRFFDSCEDAGVTIHITNGSIREIEPNGTGRLVADIIASVAAEERRQLIRRTRSGQRRAREQGKWLGQVPAGFARVDGYLKPNLDPDYSSGETGFLDVVEALESVEAGDSYNKTAGRTPNITRQTLSTIHQDDERRAWYLDLEADDDRVLDAVSELDV